jgi:uncharacterized protein YyaL (SSP411 family)
MDVLLASPIYAMSSEKSRHQLTRMWSGLRSMETAENPSYDDWEVVSNALNMMETLVVMGWARDEDGLIEDAVHELAVAGQRHVDTGAPIRLSGKGIQTIRALLEDYATALEELPHRTMMSCHRLTEKRVQDIMAKRVQTHDVVVKKGKK